VKKNNCKSKGLPLPQSFHNRLRSDLVALEREHLIESFLDAEQTLRFRLVEQKADHLLECFATCCSIKPDLPSCRTRRSLASGLRKVNVSRLTTQIELDFPVAFAG
jgi:hypothetical protein